MNKSCIILSSSKCVLHFTTNEESFNIRLRKKAFKIVISISLLFELSKDMANYINIFKNPQTTYLSQSISKHVPN